MERRRLIAGAAGALLFSLAPCQIAWGAKLVNVRMWPAAEYTRVTIETDEPLKYKHFFVRSAKPRIFEFFGCFKAVKIKVIDFESACFISFQQRKGRAFDCTRPSESAKHRADQTCLARTKIALQTHGQS